MVNFLIYVAKIKASVKPQKFLLLYKERAVRALIKKKKGYRYFSREELDWEIYKKKYRYKNFNRRSFCAPKFLHNPVFNKFLKVITFKSRKLKIWFDILKIAEKLKREAGIKNSPLYLYYTVASFLLFSFSSRQRIKKYRRDVMITIVPYLIKKHKTYFHALRDFKFFLKKKKKGDFKGELIRELSKFKANRSALDKTESQLFILKRNKVTLVAENSQYLHYRWQ